MKKIIITVLSILFIGAGIYFGKDFLPVLTSNQGKLNIQSSPKVTVFINGEKKSDSTPFVTKIAPGSYEVKLIPENQATTSSWQQLIAVNPGVETFINAELGQTETASAWQTILLEKTGRNEIELAMFSQTDIAEIFIDGQKKGTTPLSLKDVSPGIHELKFISTGASEYTVKIKVISGFKHQINTQLARLNQTPTTDTNTPSSSKEPTKTSKVKILSTPTGWLRVRSEPSTAGKELAKVNPDEEFVYVEEQEGWYKIVYEADKEGWISSEFAEKVE